MSTASSPRDYANRGIDVTTTVDADLMTAGDPAQLAFATEAERVLVTHDADFLRLHASGADHCGIVFCAMQSRTISEIIQGLLLVHDCLEAKDMRGEVEFL